MGLSHKICKLSLIATSAFLILGSLANKAQAQDSTSGTIEKGLRILELKKRQKSADFTVYRGDYVKLKLDSSEKEIEFAIPDLQFKEKISPDLEKSKFVKMIKEGVFAYSAGKTKGKIKVIEYQQANYKAITAQEAKELIDNVKPLILDVRSKFENEKARIPGSILIPVDEIQARYSELEKYKNQDIFTYCASGNRSTVASRVLVEKGFKRLYNLRTGIGDWINAGYPVEK